MTTDAQALLQGWSRETTIMRDDQGRWFHDGEALLHPNLVRSFESWIERAEDGRYCLKNDINWAYITLHGPPYFVRAARIEGDRMLLSLSGGTEEVLDPTTLRQGPEGALYCSVRDGTMAARFERHVMTQLASHIDEDAKGAFIVLGERKVRPVQVDDPVSWQPATAQSGAQR